MEDDMQNINFAALPHAGRVMPINKVGLIVIKDRKVLMARSRGQKLAYNLGGKVEPGESDEQALARECLEEANIKLLLETCTWLHTFKGFAPDGRMLTIRAYTGEYEGTPAHGSEVEELDWFTSKDGKRTTPMGRQILEYLAAANLID
jgi:8-oxo-dGTP diphosphatase